MSSLPPNLTSTAADWRRSLQVNNRRTYIVIFIFFLIYFAMGMLVDVYLNLNTYSLYSSNVVSQVDPDAAILGDYINAPIAKIFFALITFKIFPLVTLIMLGIAAISILITFAFHDKLMLLGTDYHEVTPTNAQTLQEQQLYNVIEELKIAAGLRFMPKVFIIDAPYMNAFASGYSEKSAMVAITRGLLQKLTRAELQAVMAHEISHIRHLDIKLTLMASVLANLTIMVLDLLFYNMMFSRKNSDKRSDALVFIIILLRYLLPVINILLLLYLSRTREYMADAGCVELLRDNQPLASALLKINNDYTQHQQEYAAQPTPHENVRREAYIFDPAQAGFSSMHSLTDLFSTHPNIKDRLAALGFKYNDS